MNYSNFPNDKDVVRDLGQPFIHLFIESVEGARSDLSAFREWQPSWQPNFSNRFIASLLHERIWDRLIRSIGDLEGFHVTDKEPIREVRSGTPTSSELSGTAKMIPSRRTRLLAQIYSGPTAV